MPTLPDEDALAALERLVTDALLAALAALDPMRLVAERLGPRPEGRWSVIAVGKAAARMAAGVTQAWTADADQALVVVPLGDEGEPVRVSRGPTERVVAAHPLPDEQSFAAGERALSLAAGLGADDTLVALVSGGASALMAACPPGLGLEDKRALVATMLERGAPIADLNLVRRHLSPVKGGALAVAAHPARVRCLMLGDVIGGEVYDIGSGPVVQDPTTREEATRSLARWAPELSARLSPFLREAPLVRAAPDGTNEATVLADPSALGAAVAAALRARGVRALHAPAEQGDAAEIVRRRVAEAGRLAPGDALVVPCEATLTLPAVRGEGGRAGWMALAALEGLPDDVVFLSAASDGVDGTSGAAGALVSARHRGEVSGEETARALRQRDDAAVHRRLGTRLELPPTGTNLTDVHVLARLR